MSVRNLSVAMTLIAVLILGTARASDDLLFVSNNFEYDVLQIDATGNKSVFAMPGEPNQPTGLAIDNSGNLYVAISNGSSFGAIRRYSPTGQDLGNFATAGFNSPQGIAFDGAGNLYVVNFNEINKYSSTGQFLGLFASTGDNNPYDLVFDASGVLHVSLFNGGAVKRFSASGEDLGDLTSVGFSNNLSGLALDAAGNLYVADYSNGNVRMFSSSGEDLGLFVSEGLVAPTDIAFDSSGYLHVLNDYFPDSKVRVFSPTGEDLGNVATGLSQPSFLAFKPQAIPPQTPIEECLARIDLVQNDLDAIFFAGGIGGNNAPNIYRRLTSKLQDAVIKLDKGKYADTLRKLNDFRTAVISLRCAAKPKLSAASADLLLNGDSDNPDPLSDLIDEGLNGVIVCVEELLL